jgi:CHASE3 domain sensor protein
MDFQSAFNLAIGLVAFLGGYILRSISESLKSLQTADAALTQKVQDMEVLVAGQYVKHSDLEKLTSALFSKLDKISDKLDTKMDKH